MTAARRRDVRGSVTAATAAGMALCAPRMGVAEWSSAAALVLGREDEVAGVLGVLADARLVTLTGAPGVGKTCLARAVAERYAGDVALVELAPIADPGGVLPALATALGLTDLRTITVETLAVTLRGGERLLVVDNCEHLRRPVARMLGELLAASPDLRVLASSREPLGRADEHEWRVPPLAVPARSAAPVPEELLGYPAVALFVERARDVQPGFELNAYLADDVAEVCRRLEGVPLAIELAAARVAALTPGEILRRLEDRLSLLNNGGRSSVPRHRTLTAALDWSDRLLTAPERALLRRLSVFAKRFEVDAAAGACAGEQVDPPGVPALLARLVAKSLVVSEPGEPVRYHLLETVRAYAAQKLEQAGEGGELRTAHAQFYVELAERAEPELAGADQERWLRRLEAERADLCAAVEWSLSSGQPEVALRLTGALVLFWRVRGHYDEGRDLLATALAASEGASPVLRARSQWGLGFLTVMAGDPRGALPDLEESLAESRAQGDAQGAARALLILANARQHWEDPSVASLLEESIRLAREAGDTWCLAHALGVAGFECARHHELRRGRRMFEECVAVARTAGDFQGLRYGLIGLGEVAGAQGDYREAQSLLEEAVELTRALGEDFDRATALAILGELALDRGQYDRAEDLLEESLALLPEPAPADARPSYVAIQARVAHARGDLRRARELLNGIASTSRGTGLLLVLAELAAGEGSPDEARQRLEDARELARAEGNDGSLSRALHGLGQIARDGGDPEHAAALHDESLAIEHRIGARPRIADSLDAIAGLAGGAGHQRYAARLFGAAEALRERIGYARLPWDQARYDADMALVSRSMSADKLRSALAEGRRLSLADAVGEAASAPLRTRPAEGWATLTEREREVAELVAQGLTNPEIAERLMISRETVKTHVSNILAKLGVTGRWQLAREVRNRTSRIR